VSPRSLFAVMLALVLGGSAAVGVSSYVKNRPEAANPDLTKVVVAAFDIPRGSVLTTDQVKLRDVPKGQVHALAITTLDDAVNRAVMTPLLKDEALLEGKLAPKGSRGSMAWVTKPGMRAFTIHTPSVASGVAGFVMPGDHVDVLLTMSGADNDGTGGGSTSTLLQNLEVMAVDQKIEAPADNKVDTNMLRSVTLLVTPEQSLKLDLGQNKGMLHLSLRNPEDLEDAQTKMATLSELRYREEPPKVVEEPPAPPPALAPAPAPVDVEAPKPLTPKPIFVYHAHYSKVVQHETDGTSGRRVLTEGTGQTSFPSTDRGPYSMEVR